MKTKISSYILVFLISTFLIQQVNAQCDKYFVYKKIKEVIKKDSVIYLRDFIKEQEDGKNIDTWTIALTTNVNYRFYIFTNGKVEDAILNIYKFSDTEQKILVSNYREEKYFNFFDFECYDSCIYNISIIKKNTNDCVFSLQTYVKRKTKF